MHLFTRDVTRAIWTITYFPASKEPIGKIVCLHLLVNYQTQAHHESLTHTKKNHPLLLRRVVVHWFQSVQQNPKSIIHDDCICLQILSQKTLMKFVICFAAYMQFKEHSHITNKLQTWLSQTLYHFNDNQVCVLWTRPLWLVSHLTDEETDQLAHVTVVNHVIYIWLLVSCLLRGIIWQSDKQTDRQTDKQRVGSLQRSHCQSHYHSVPL